MFWADLDKNLVMKGNNMVVDVRGDKAQLKIYFLARQVIMLHYVIDPKLW